MPELKNCPLCNRHAEMTSPVKGIWNVGCGDGFDTCGLVLFGGEKDKRKDMAEKWNRRGEGERCRN